MSVPEQDASPPIALSLSEDSRVATLTINREARRNALDTAAWLALTDKCHWLASNKRIRVVILRGTGEHFCAGADLSELAANITDAQWMLASQGIVGEALDAYASLPMPTIAAVRGCCFGGGMALAVSSDFVYAESRSRFAITPAKLGLSYRLVDCLRVVEAVGARRARTLLFAAHELNGETALEWGIVTALSDDPPDEASAQAERLLQLSGTSQRAIKANLLKIRHGAICDDAATIAAFRNAFAGPDFAEGAAAFLEKRAAVF